MTTPIGPDRPLSDPPRGADPETMQTPATPHTGHGAHGAHRWMMLICCIPMIAIVALLIVSGTAGAGTLLWAVGCMAMMAAMMFIMPGGHDHR